MTKIPNCLVNCFEHLYFRNYNLFRISDFVLRNSKNWFQASCFEFAFLFNLGVLCPVEYLLDRKDIGFAVKLFHRESDLFLDSLNPNSTENFKYV